MNYSSRVFQHLLIALLLWPIVVLAEVNLTPAEAENIGRKIWQNEGAGKVENLAVWNAGEDFPSFGIGHFIWYPTGVSGIFEESFPQLLSGLAQERELPVWLVEGQGAPWRSREEFLAMIDDPVLQELRALLADTVVQQTVFIVARMQAALPVMLEALDEPAAQAQVARQFARVANAPNGLYALIDYVNFKGEGTSPRERYRGEGWGLLQVLEQMDENSPDVMTEFARAADFVLTRRVANADRDESRWLPGWRKRVATYVSR
ncbi:MAG: hypothetical protein LBV36_01350 [Chromatiales bacterium]|jgi:hypothetical protein|nr:hypothetical protein [Chromatiales bacterium]